MGPGRHRRVLAEGDSLQSHADDTLVAGAGLCDLAATRFVFEHAPGAIAWQSLKLNAGSDEADLESIFS
jgi:aspartate oxidase